MRWSHYKSRRRALAGGAIIILVFLVFADRMGWLLIRHPDDMAAYHGITARMTRVIDGNTIEVNIPDALNRKSSTRVRLCGINCPEFSRSVSAAAAEPLAQEAADCTRSLVEDVDMRIWLDAQHTRDAFGAVLARVELPDGRAVNEILLEQGLARANDRIPHAQLTRYAQLELTARRRRIGIWSIAIK
jgi:micrococcal nuclease